MNNKFKLFYLVYFVLLLVINLGCSGRLVKISEMPKVEQEKLGYVTGTGCGSLLLSYPPASFIPIALNSRFYRAEQDALRKAPGARGLINVTIEESWFWWIIGTTRCTALSGEAVR